VVSIIGTNFRDWCRRILDPLTKDTLDGEEFYLHRPSQCRSSKGDAQLPARCASINREMLGRWTKMIQEYYRQMRKFGCNILAVVQQYDIIKESAVRGAMIGNSNELLKLNRAGQNRKPLAAIDRRNCRLLATRPARAHTPE
jgi:hypothetical protein